MFKTILCDIQGVLLDSSGFNNELASFLMQQKSGNYEKLILYSNLSNNTIQRLRQEHSAFFSFVDRAYSYESVKYSKPDSRGFKEILQENDIKASETIFIDDSKVNIDVAKELGFEVIHYKGSEAILSLKHLLSL